MLGILKPPAPGSYVGISRVTILSYGFRPKGSTMTAWEDIQLDWANETEKKNVSGISAVFDTLDVNIFCDKIMLYGFQPITVSWFRSFMTGRTQCVKIGNRALIIIFSSKVYCKWYSTTFKIQHLLCSFEIQWFKVMQIIENPYFPCFEKCFKDFTFPSFSNLKPGPWFADI